MERAAREGTSTASASSPCTPLRVYNLGNTSPMPVTRMVAILEKLLVTFLVAQLPDSPAPRSAAGSVSSPPPASPSSSSAALSRPPPRLQLALAALLRRDLLPDASSPTDLFDPVLSATECAAAIALGFAIPSLNDGCRRRAGEPTLFYMPHCEASLYDTLLAANWEPRTQLRQVCVLGNSFRQYALQAEENSSGPAAKAKLVLAANRFAWEERVNEVSSVDDDDGFHIYAYPQSAPYVA